MLDHHEHVRQSKRRGDADEEVASDGGAPVQTIFNSALYLMAAY
jgi:hypothetical protein